MYSVRALSPSVPHHQQPGGAGTPAIGGLYSSVADLATWVGGFTAAFSDSEERDDHRLNRATRRDMQLQSASFPPRQY